MCRVLHMCSLHLQISWWRVDVFDMYQFSFFTAFVSFILTYRLLGLQQISRLCFAVLLSTVRLQAVTVCADLSWYMWARCCVLVAQQTGTVGIQPKRWLQRCTSAPSSNEATSSKKWSLSVRIAASWASVFLQKLLFDFYLSFRFFYYCILILHRFSFSLWILINTLQNDNKPSWILKYLHKCKIQKVRWNRILPMVLETTMMQDKKQAGSETRVKIMWQTGSKNWNMTRKPTKDKHLTGRRAQREEPSAM